MGVSIDRKEGTVEISLRDNFSQIGLQKINVGAKVEGKVVRVKPYGVFVDIGAKRDALLHISRMALYRVSNISDHAKIGQKIKARVLRADPKGTKSIAISML